MIAERKKIQKGTHVVLCARATLHSFKNQNLLFIKLNNPCFKKIKLNNPQKSNFYEKNLTIFQNI